MSYVGCKILDQEYRCEQADAQAFGHKGNIMLDLSIWIMRAGSAPKRPRSWIM